MTQSILKEVEAAYPDKVTTLRLPIGCGVLGRLKNLGVYWSEKVFGRGNALYIMDNDGHYTEGWDDALSTALWKAQDEGYRLLGPYRHPYHLGSADHIVTLPSDYMVVSTDAVQGIGHLMTWETWDRYGPYDANAPGTNQSEDYAFCRRVVAAGFLVGSIQPDIVYNCGITDTFGRPCVGAECMTERISGVSYE